MFKTVFHAVAVCLVSTSALALTPAATRGLRNVETALNGVTLVPELRNGPIPSDKQQTAKNLKRDLDSALARAHGELDRLSDADKADAKVVELTKKVEELEAFRADLTKAMEGGAAASAGNEAQYRAFKEETKPYAKWVSIWRQGAHGDAARTKEGLAELAKLDELCRMKYASLQPDDKLGFKVGIDPASWCAIAAKREETVKATAGAAAEEGLEAIVESVKAARLKLAPNKGLVAVDGTPYKLLQDREKGKATIAARLKPVLAAAGKPETVDFGPLDKELDAFGAEIDRLAPTWTFDAKYSDAEGEAAAKKFFASEYPGRTVVKCGFEFQAATVSKNSRGVPLERYRTGAILAKGAGKWCEYRSFTTHEAWGGKDWEAPRVTIGAVRFQKCP